MRTVDLNRIAKNGKTVLQNRIETADRKPGWLRRQFT
jgi:hypothetical protein